MSFRSEITSVPDVRTKLGRVVRVVGGLLDVATLGGNAVFRGIRCSGVLPAVGDKVLVSFYRNNEIVATAVTSGDSSTAPDSTLTINTGGGGGGAGTVNSVGLTMPGIFAVTGSPIISSGDLGVTLNTQPATYGLFGPAAELGSGSSTPTFRRIHPKYDIDWQWKPGPGIYGGLLGVNDDGDLWIEGTFTGGQTAKQNISVSPTTGLTINNNGVERFGLSSAGVMTIKDSSGAAVFTFDASSGAEFTKPLTLGAAGGIYQGTGTFASPTTGLKIWNDTGLGRIAGYNAGVLQWYANTDGKLYAGAGAVSLSDSGIRIDSTSSRFGKSSIEWWKSGVMKMSIGTGTDLGTVTSTYIETTVDFDITTTSAMLINAAGGVSLLGSAGVSLPDSVSMRTYGQPFGQFFASSVVGADVTLTLPTVTGTLALTSNITTAVNGAISGTANYIPKFTGANVIGNTSFYESSMGVLKSASTAQLISEALAGPTAQLGAITFGVGIESAVTIYATNATRTVSIGFRTVDNAIPMAGDPTVTGNTTLAGNLKFSGAARRIALDASAATVADRTLLVPNTVDTAMWLGAIPTGTGIGTTIRAYRTSDTTLSAYIQMGAFSASTSINSTVVGAATQLPLSFNIGGTPVIVLTALKTALVTSTATDTPGIVTDASGNFEVKAGNTGLGGNLQFGGTGRRIIADMANSVMSNRLAFQGTAANATLMVLPAAATTGSWVRVHTQPDPSNSQIFQFGMTAAAAYIGTYLITADVAGGTALGIQFVTSGANMMYLSPAGGVRLSSTLGATPSVVSNAVGNLQLDASLGFTNTLARIVGNMDDATHSNRLALVTSGTNAITTANVIPSGSATQSAWRAHNANDMSNAGLVQIGQDASYSFIQATKTGTGTALPLRVVMGSTEAQRWTTGATVLYPSMAAPGSPAEGEEWTDSTQKARSTRLAGITQNFVGTIFTGTANATVGNTTTDTSIMPTGVGTNTLPANFWTVGKSVRIKAWGILTKGSTSATRQYTLLLGATTIKTATTAAATTVLTNDGWQFDCLITCRTTGVSGTVYAQMRQYHYGIADPVLVGTATVTIDTTASAAIDYKFKWSANDASNSMVLTNIAIEVLN